MSTGCLTGEGHSKSLESSLFCFGNRYCTLLSCMKTSLCAFVRWLISEKSWYGLTLFSPQNKPSVQYHLNKTLEPDFINRRTQTVKEVKMTMNHRLWIIVHDNIKAAAYLTKVSKRKCQNQWKLEKSKYGICLEIWILAAELSLDVYIYSMSI